jgi:hypothetical protein
MTHGAIDGEMMGKEEHKFPVFQCNRKFSNILTAYSKNALFI